MTTATDRPMLFHALAVGVQLELPTGFVELPLGADQLPGQELAAAGYVRYGVDGAVTARLEIDRVAKVPAEHEAGAAGSVLRTLAAMGGEPFEPFERVIDGAVVTGVHLRYPDGLPDPADALPADEVSGPGAVIVLAAVTFGGAVHTLAFLSGDEHVHEQLPEFHRALDSARFLTSRGHDRRGRTARPVFFGDRELGVSLVAPAGWAVHRSPESLRLIGPPDPRGRRTTFTVTSEAADGISWHRRFLGREVELLAGAVPGYREIGREDFDLHDDTAVTALTYCGDEPSVSQVRAWISASARRLFAVSASTAPGRDDDLPVLADMLRSIRLMPAA
ncbi:hypothetical protein GIS00_19580 [Nakamurella sp. YIM 132087]|uniref:Uncharacterized protein n=1 Tax=Nakamurella alba TaxID=2665158 RepID=A0A7K1FTL7_9ACTN|nr:hypothetical protein [Nakamurella alba]MTD16144.1 hypothetical protein [Nakamurella alba]